MIPSQRLHELGLTLPPPAAPVGAYVPAVGHGAVIRTTGQLAFVDGAILEAGRLGAEVSVEAGRAAARQAALNALAAAAAVAGGVDRIERILELVGYVSCDVGFTGMSAVVDGASQVLVDIFGEAGRHVRTNVGVAWLPLGSPVEISLVVVGSESL